MEVPSGEVHLFAQHLTKNHSSIGEDHPLGPSVLLHMDLGGMAKEGRDSCLTATQYNQHGNQQGGSGESIYAIDVVDCFSSLPT